EYVAREHRWRRNGAPTDALIVRRKFLASHKEASWAYGDNYHCGKQRQVRSINEAKPGIRLFSGLTLFHKRLSEFELVNRLQNGPKYRTAVITNKRQMKSH